MRPIGPDLIERVDDLRRRVVNLGRLHEISGRQMAQLCRVQPKRVRSYLADPSWREDDIGLLVEMERALAVLGLLNNQAPPPSEILMAGPVEREEGSTSHRKVYLDAPAALLDAQLRYVSVYMRAAAKDGVVHERDISYRRLRSRAPDCAIHVYEIGDESADEIGVAEWIPMPDYWDGADITGAEIKRDFPAGMAQCIREDVVSALRVPSRPHWTLLRRQFPEQAVHIPARTFLRLIQFFVGHRDVPKMLIARRLQPMEAAAHYLHGFGEI